MLRWIIGSSIRLRFLVLTFALVLVVFGVLEISKIPVDVYPEFNPAMVEVQTEALGLSAAEMEALITVPIEADLLNGVAWLEHIYSESVPGLSSILLVFEEGTDPIKARQMVQERLTDQVACAIQDVLAPKGVGVVIEAVHLCMMMRGIEKQNSKTITSALRGVFKNDLRTREEFLRLVASQALHS